MESWLLDILRCPQDGQPVKQAAEHLECSNGHRYLVVDGIPVMLFDDKNATHDYIRKTLEKVSRIEGGEPVGEVVEIRTNSPGEIDPYVPENLPYTCGNLYFPAMKGIDRYPFPDLRIAKASAGELLIDIGCNWGRWSIAASEKGYRAVGIDPSLDAALAAQRIARQLDRSAVFVVGDARSLPFATNAFDKAFSFGVFQHFSKTNTNLALDEMSRVLKNGHEAVVQMATSTGIRSRQQHRRRGFTEGDGFDVRYWSPDELVSTFESKFGPTKLTADSYFGLCVHRSDADIMPLRFRIIVYTSELLRRASLIFKPLAKVADGVYLHSINSRSSRDR
ncbi:MAG: methyltransferase domain-containing protein [Pyrinomonadaceae bacterium]